MDKQALKNVRPIFAILSFVCLILPIPIARLAIYLFAPSEDYLGFGGLSVALVGMLITLLTGATLAVVSLFRHERPRLFSALCLISHSIIVLWIFFNRPG